MPDPSVFLRVLDDKFTPVRDRVGRLLGCIPRQADSAEHVIDTSGRIYPLMFAAQVCVLVDVEAGESPVLIDGFVALDDANADLAIPAVAAGDDPDLAQEP